MYCNRKNGEKERVGKKGDSSRRRGNVSDNSDSPTLSRTKLPVSSGSGTSQCSNPSSSSDTTPNSISPSLVVEPRPRSTSTSSVTVPSSVQVESDRRKRVEKASRARFYLLRQSGPTAFTVAGDSPEHKYRVMLGPQTCSCSRGPHCVHLLFVMLRVLQVEQTNPLLWSKTLRNYEVDSLLTEMRERKRKRISRSSSMTRSEQRLSDEHQEALMQRSNQSEEKEMQVAFDGRTDNEDIISGGNEALCGGSEKGEDEDEDICPICLLEMVEGESLTVHINGCGNSLHHHCMAICMYSVLNRAC